MGRYITVVETRPFIADAAECLTEEEREDLVGYMARNPTAGVVIPGSSGVRKVRWRVSGRGKRGGARIIYYYHSEVIPLFLLAAYRKARKADLTPAERSSMRRVVSEIVTQYMPKRKTHSPRRRHV